MMKRFSRKISVNGRRDKASSISRTRPALTLHNTHAHSFYADTKCLGSSSFAQEGMGKKGFLLGEFTLKTVLAILGILLLIYLLATLYATFSQQKAIEQATGGVSRVLEGVGRAAAGTPFDYILTEPKGWKLIYYESGLSSVPECAGVQCVCLCKVPSFWRVFTSQQSYCADVGVCKKIEGIKFVMPAEVLIDGPTGISIRKDGEGVVRLTHP